MVALLWDLAGASAGYAMWAAGGKALTPLRRMRDGSGARRLQMS